MHKILNKNKLDLKNSGYKNLRNLKKDNLQMYINLTSNHERITIRVREFYRI